MNARKARAMIAIGADSKELARDLADARKKLKAFGKDVPALTAGKIGKGVMGGVVGGGAMLAGLGGLQAVAGELFDFEKNLTRFQIASGKANGQIDAMRSSILGVARATGISSNEILAGAQTYVDLTGDVVGAERAMSSFARIAQASGASVSDVAQATAAMQMSGKLAAEEIEAVWSGLITQGKSGAVGVKDLAGELATLMPMMAKFSGGTGAAGIRDMGAALQVVRRGAGSAAEASTKLQSLIGSLVKSAPKLRKAGIEVFKWNPKTKMRELISFREIVEKIAAKKLDAEKLGKVLGTDKESIQAIDMLTSQIGLYDELRVAAQDTGAVQRDMLTYLASPAGKLEVALQNVKTSIAEALTPDRITSFADALVKVADLFAKIVGFASELSDATGIDEVWKGDYAGAVAAQALKGSDRMTVEQKRERAQKLMTEGAIAESEADGDSSSIIRGRGLRKAGEQLARESDAWGAGNGVSAGFDPMKFQFALLEALAKATIVVQADGSAVAKTVDNAVSRRKPVRK